MSRSNAVLFVCSGNICRSPLAAGLFCHALERLGQRAAIRVDSAGTQAAAGLPPTELAIAIAAAYGVDISAARSRRIGPGDFARYGRIIAMDHGHLDLLVHTQPASYIGVIALMTTDGGKAFEVPDPYGGGRRDYAKAGRLIAVGVRSLINDLFPEAGLDWDCD